MSPRVFRAGNLHLKLDAAVVEILMRFVQNHAGDLEAGGVLIGRRIDGTTDSVVDEITTPMKRDRRTRTSFARTDQAHQKRIDDAWTDSGGTSSYLGEWHTHPEPSPLPSRIDWRDWRRRLRVDLIDADDVYFVVVGTKKMSVWHADRRTGRLARMVPDGSLSPSERETGDARSG